MKKKMESLMSELYDDMEIGDNMYIIIDKMSPFRPEMFSKKSDVIKHLKRESFIKGNWAEIEKDEGFYIHFSSEKSDIFEFSKRKKRITKKTKRDNFSLRDFEICDIEGIREGIENL
jgi:hypothetical protein